MTALDLNLDIAKALGPGRRAMPLVAEVEREITDADIAMLAHSDSGTAPQPIKKVTERHHMVARLLAVGTKPGEVAMITGYEPARISILQNSPAMQELIELYKTEVDEQFASVLDHMAGMSKDAILEIRDRLEESPEDFSLKNLQDIAEMALDRTGHPRAKEMNTNINVNFADKLNAARERAKRVASGEVVDASYEEIE